MEKRLVSDDDSGEESEDEDELPEIERPPPKKRTLKQRLSCVIPTDDAKHLSLFNDLQQSPKEASGPIKKSRATMFSQGNKLSPVPVQLFNVLAKTESRSFVENLKLESPSSENDNVANFGEPGSPKSPKSGSRQSMTDFARPTLQDTTCASPKGIRKTSVTPRTKKRRSWLTHRQVKFQGPNGRPDVVENVDNYVDALALERSRTGPGQQLVHQEAALLNHRDSLVIASLSLHSPDLLPALAVSPRPSRSQRTRQSSDPSLIRSAEGSVVRAFRRVPMFTQCSERFLSLLAAEAEALKLNVGDMREVGEARVGARGRSNVTCVPCAVVVQSGSCRVEVDRRALHECCLGSAYGLANMLAVVSACRFQESGQQAVDHFMLRPTGSEPCRCLLVNSKIVRRALAECPADQAHLREIMHVVSRSTDSTHLLLSVLECSDSAKDAMINGSVRHVFMPGEVICKQGAENPVALIMVRSGVVALEIDGVEVRSISSGQAIGEEMLCNACHAWAVTAVCLTHCDIQILHRHLFLPAVREMQNGTTPVRSESNRLLYICDGKWKDSRAVLAYPLLNGYSDRLLTRIAGLLETRLILPQHKCWEGGPNGFEASGIEIALYCLLSGTCVDSCSSKSHGTRSASKKITRELLEGACFGSTEFLGMRGEQQHIVTAKTICLVAVLHRKVFLHALDGLSNLEKKHQPAEIAQILKAIMERTSSRDERTSSRDGQPQLQFAQESSQKKGVQWKAVPPTGYAELARELPIFRPCHCQLVERACRMAVHLFYLAGQHICRSGSDMDAMFVLGRGTACMMIADQEIKRYKPGQAIGCLAFAASGFSPCFTIVCETTSELWALHRIDFLALLDGFPLDRARLTTILKAELRHSRLVLSEDREGEVELPGTYVALEDIPLFQDCSHKFLEWVTRHLETVVLFPNDVIMNEFDEDSSLYIVCEGTVYLEFSDESGRHTQSTLACGKSFGEQRLLGVIDHAEAEAHVMEITILQVLHRSIFKHALTFFPAEAEYFDKTALSMLSKRHQLHLASLPFFTGCDLDFCQELERLMSIKLVRSGDVIVAQGASGINESLYLIRNGTAVKDARNDQENGQKAVEPTILHRETTCLIPSTDDAPTSACVRQGQVVNADVVLGMVQCAQDTVRAKSTCAVAQIDSRSFYRILQRYPLEVERLLRSQSTSKTAMIAASSGSLWPTEPEMVPLFAGVGKNFFSALMDSAEWHMFLPEQYVTRQGRVGEMLFLLCYGAAVLLFDSFVVGELAPGECFGKRNLLGLHTEYDMSLQSKTVSHFRLLKKPRLEQLLTTWPAERERFQKLRSQTEREAAEISKSQMAKVWQDKLEQRRQNAFRSHVSNVRNERGVAMPFSSPDLVAAGIGPPDASPELALPAVASPSETDHGSSKAVVGNSGSPGSRESMRPRTSMSPGSPGSPGSRDSMRPRTSTREENFSDWVSLSAKRSASACGPEHSARTHRGTVAPNGFKSIAFMQRMRKAAGRAQKRCEHRQTTGTSENDSGGSSSDGSEGSPLAGGSGDSSPKSTARIDSFDSDKCKRKSLQASSKRASVASARGDVASAHSQPERPAGGAPKPRRRCALRALEPSTRTMPSSQQSRRQSHRPGQGKKAGAGRNATSGNSQDQVGTSESPSEASSADGSDPDSENDQEQGKSPRIQDRQRGMKKKAMKATKAEQPMKVLVTDLDAGASPPSEDQEPGSPGSQSITEQLFFSKMHDFANAKTLSRTERIEAAIETHRGDRQRKLARGKVLRALYSGNNFNKEKLLEDAAQAELTDDVAEDREKEANEQKVARARRRASIDVAMQACESRDRDVAQSSCKQGTVACEKALLRKFKRLSGILQRG